MTQRDPVFFRGAEIAVFGKEREDRGMRFLSKPRSNAMPTNSATTLLVMDSMLCSVFASCGAMPIHVDPRMSSPSKYCSYTSIPFRTTTTPCGSARFSSARPGPIAQISFGSSPCCAGVATAQSSDIAAGASQSADVTALATAVRSTTQSAADPIQCLHLPPRADASRESRLRRETCAGQSGDINLLPCRKLKGSAGFQEQVAGTNQAAGASE